MPSLILTGTRRPNPMLPFLPGFRDNFNRPDGPLIAASGRPYRYITSNNNPRADVVIQNNAATVVLPDGATGSVAAVIDSRSANGALEAVLKTKGTQGGSLFLRGTDLSNCLELSMRLSAGDLRPVLFSRTTASGRVILAQAANGYAPIHDGSRFVTVLDGPRIVVYHDDVPIMAAETTDHLTRDAHGIYAYAAGAGMAWDELNFYA